MFSTSQVNNFLMEEFFWQINHWITLSLYTLHACKISRWLEINNYFIYKIFKFQVLFLKKNYIQNLSLWIKLWKRIWLVQNLALKYRGIRLHIVELRNETTISENQFGFITFMSRWFTMEAIFFFRCLMEKYSEARKDLRMIIIDLEHMVGYL